MAHGDIRVKVEILPEIETTDELIASLIGEATQAANRLSTTPVTDIRYVTRATWPDALGERPEDMRVDYLIYEGTGTPKA